MPADNGGGNGPSVPQTQQQQQSPSTIATVTQQQHPPAAAADDRFILPNSFEHTSGEQGEWFQSLFICFNSFQFIHINVNTLTENTQLIKLSLIYVIFVHKKTISL